MRSAVRLGRFAGVDILADPSATLLPPVFGAAIFLMLREAAGFGLSGAGPTGTEPFATGQAGLVAVVAGALMLLSAFLHEASHVVVATRSGLRVHSMRLSVLGGHTVVGGVPDLSTERRVALAGPATSLVVAAVCLAVGLIDPESPLGTAAMTLATANLTIAMLNLLPGFPLDGGRMARGILVDQGRSTASATRIVTRIGRILGMTVLGVGVVLLSFREPVGVLWVLIGWVLLRGSIDAGRREEYSIAYGGVVVRDLTRRTPAAIPGTASVASVFDGNASISSLPPTPVVMSGTVVGLVSQRSIDSISPSRWPSTRVIAIADRIGPEDVVEADMPLEQFVRTAGTSNRTMVVVDSGTAIGVLDEGVVR